MLYAFVLTIAITSPRPTMAVEWPKIPKFTFPKIEIKKPSFKFKKPAIIPVCGAVFAVLTNPTTRKVATKLASYGAYPITTPFRAVAWTRTHWVESEGNWGKFAKSLPIGAAKHFTNGKGNAKKFLGASGLYTTLLIGSLYVGPVVYVGSVLLQPVFWLTGSGGGNSASVPVPTAGQPAILVPSIVNFRPEEAVLYVNGFTPGESGYEKAKQDFAENYGKKYLNAIYLEPKTPEELTKALTKIASKQGMPFNKLNTVMAYGENGPRWDGKK